MRISFLVLLIAFGLCGCHSRTVGNNADTVKINTAADSVPFLTSEEVSAKEPKVTMYEAPTHLVNILSAKAVMDSDMNKGYKISFENNSKKMIVALQITIDFNRILDKHSAHPRDTITNCIISPKIRIDIQPNSTKTYLLKIDSNEITCDFNPDFRIITVVYSDGSFKKYGTLTEEFFRNEQDEKN